MNKNLEQEYRELMAEDMPDLRDRIEAGLEPKQPVEVRREQSGSRGGQSRRRRYGAWGIAAAACLCLAVAGLGTAYQNRLGGMSGFTDGGENAAWENNGPQMGETEWAGEAMNGGIHDLGQGEEYTAMDAERPQEPAAALLEVRVRVLEKPEDADGEVYTVQVEEAAGEALSEGDIIRIWGSGIPEEGLAEQKSYQMELSVPTDGAGGADYFVVTVRFLENE